MTQVKKTAQMSLPQVGSALHGRAISGMGLPGSKVSFAMDAVPEASTFSRHASSPPRKQNSQLSTMEKVPGRWAL